jgi:hypothetical protein
LPEPKSYPPYYQGFPEFPEPELILSFMTAYRWSRCPAQIMDSDPDGTTTLVSE